jgi:hypothetical protein
MRLADILAILERIVVTLVIYLPKDKSDESIIVAGYHQIINTQASQIVVVSTYCHIVDMRYKSRGLRWLSLTSRVVGLVIVAKNIEI